MLPNGDENSETVSLNFNFNFFNKSFSALTFNTNGYVYFDTTYLIFDLNYNLDTTMNGGIYYQNLESTSNDFSLIKTVVKTLNPSFIPNDIFRITYDNVPANGQSSLIVSFQVILASSSSSSFVVLNFTSCPSNRSLSLGPSFNYNPVFITNPCFSSNINSNGLWVFDLSGQSGSGM